MVRGCATLINLFSVLIHIVIILIFEMLMGSRTVIDHEKVIQ